MSQKRKKHLLIFALIFSLVIEFAGICTGPEKPIISRTCIIAFAVIFPLCLHKLYRLSYEKEFPELVTQEKIELGDERNTQIRLLAKARTSDIIRLLLLALGAVSYITGGTLWLTLAVIGVSLLAYILEWHFTSKYQTKM